MLEEPTMANYKKVIIVGLGALIIQAITGLAQASVSESMLSALDKDKDGLISLKEATGNVALLENFNKVDLNEDGFISLQELSVSKLVEEE